MDSPHSDDGYTTPPPEAYISDNDEAVPRGASRPCPRTPQSEMKTPSTLRFSPSGAPIVSPLAHPMFSPGAGPQDSPVIQSTEISSPAVGAQDRGAAGRPVSVNTLLQKNPEEGGKVRLPPQILEPLADLRMSRYANEYVVYYEQRASGPDSSGERPGVVTSIVFHLADQQRYRILRSPVRNARDADRSSLPLLACIQYLSGTASEHVPRYYTSWCDPQHVCLQLEDLDESGLSLAACSELVRRPSDLCTLVLHLATVLTDLHSQGYCHGAVSTKAIFLTKDTFKPPWLKYKPLSDEPSPVPPELAGLFLDPRLAPVQRRPSPSTPEARQLFPPTPSPQKLGSPPLARSSPEARRLLFADAGPPADRRVTFDAAPQPHLQQHQLQLQQQLLQQQRAAAPGLAPPRSALRPAAGPPASGAPHTLPSFAKRNPPAPKPSAASAHSPPPSAAFGTVPVGQPPPRPAAAHPPAYPAADFHGRGAAAAAPAAAPLAAYPVRPSSSSRGGARGTALAVSPAAERRTVAAEEEPMPTGFSAAAAAGGPPPFPLRLVQGPAEADLSHLVSPRTISSADRELIEAPDPQASTPGEGASPEENLTAVSPQTASPRGSSDEQPRPAKQPRPAEALLSPPTEPGPYGYSSDVLTTISPQTASPRDSSDELLAAAGDDRAQGSRTAGTPITPAAATDEPQGKDAAKGQSLAVAAPTALPAGQVDEPDQPEATGSESVSPSDDKTMDTIPRTPPAAGTPRSDEHVAAMTPASSQPAPAAGTRAYLTPARFVLPSDSSATSPAMSNTTSGSPGVSPKAGLAEGQATPHRAARSLVFPGLTPPSESSWGLTPAPRSDAKPVGPPEPSTDPAHPRQRLVFPPEGAAATPPPDPPQRATRPPVDPVGDPREPAQRARLASRTPEEAAEGQWSLLETSERSSTPSGSVAQQKAGPAQRSLFKAAGLQQSSPPRGREGSSEPSHGLTPTYAGPSTGRSSSQTHWSPVRQSERSQSEQRSTTPPGSFVQTPVYNDPSLAFRSHSEHVQDWSPARSRSEHLQTEHEASSPAAAKQQAPEWSLIRAATPPPANTAPPTDPLASTADEPVQVQLSGERELTTPPPAPEYTSSPLPRRTLPSEQSSPERLQRYRLVPGGQPLAQAWSAAEGAVPTAPPLAPSPSDDADALYQAPGAASAEWSAARGTNTPDPGEVCAPSAPEEAPHAEIPSAPLEANLAEVPWSPIRPLTQAELSAAPPQQPGVTRPRAAGSYTQSMPSGGPRTPETAALVRDVLRASPSTSRALIPQARWSPVKVIGIADPSAPPAVYPMEDPPPFGTPPAVYPMEDPPPFGTPPGATHAYRPAPEPQPFQPPSPTDAARPAPQWSPIRQREEVSVAALYVDAGREDPPEGGGRQPAARTPEALRTPPPPSAQGAPEAADWSLFRAAPDLVSAGQGGKSPARSGGGATEMPSTPPSRGAVFPRESAAPSPGRRLLFGAAGHDEDVDEPEATPSTPPAQVERSLAFTPPPAAPLDAPPARVSGDDAEPLAGPPTSSHISAAQPALRFAPQAGFAPQATAGTSLQQPEQQQRAGLAPQATAGTSLQQPEQQQQAGSPKAKRKRGGAAEAPAPKRGPPPPGTPERRKQDRAAAASSPPGTPPARKAGAKKAGEVQSTPPSTPKKRRHDRLAASSSQLAHTATAAPSPAKQKTGARALAHSTKTAAQAEPALTTPPSTPKKWVHDQSAAATSSSPSSQTTPPRTPTAPGAQESGGVPPSPSKETGGREFLQTTPPGTPKKRVQEQSSLSPQTTPPRTPKTSKAHRSGVEPASPSRKTAAPEPVQTTPPSTPKKSAAATSSSPSSQTTPPRTPKAPGAQQSGGAPPSPSRETGGREHLQTTPPGTPKKRLQAQAAASPSWGTPSKKFTTRAAGTPAGKRRDAPAHSSGHPRTPHKKTRPSPARDAPPSTPPGSPPGKQAAAASSDTPASPPGTPENKAFAADSPPRTPPASTPGKPVSAGSAVPRGGLQLESTPPGTPNKSAAASSGAQAPKTPSKSRFAGQLPTETGVGSSSQATLPGTPSKSRFAGHPRASSSQATPPGTPSKSRFASQLAEADARLVPVASSSSSQGAGFPLYEQADARFAPVASSSSSQGAGFPLHPAAEADETWVTTPPPSEPPLPEAPSKRREPKFHPTGDVYDQRQAEAPAPPTTPKKQKGPPPSPQKKLHFSDRTPSPVATASTAPGGQKSAQPPLHPFKRPAQPSPGPHRGAAAQARERPPLGKKTAQPAPVPMYLHEFIDSRGAPPSEIDVPLFLADGNPGVWRLGAWSNVRAVDGAGMVKRDALNLAAICQQQHRNLKARGWGAADGAAGEFPGLLSAFINDLPHMAPADMAGAALNLLSRFDPGATSSDVTAEQTVVGH
ncbi:hypothetical protein DIPPA_08632 [Diplonema papillatum]|nr:hypothetical protein DIPPA_08632 [Diplonema papillatum]